MRQLFLTILIAALVFFIPDLLPALADSDHSADAWLAVGGMRWFWIFRFLLSFLCIARMPLKKWRAHKDDTTNLDILAVLLAVPMILLTIRSYSRVQALTGDEPLALETGTIALLCLAWLFVDLSLAKIVTHFGLGTGGCWSSVVRSYEGAWRCSGTASSSPFSC